ncbi:MAG: hypothetical protein K2M19_05700 [Muribaculaceae bacterium]|nr:hypothetical protein [Muribaculaceae bacterium]
MRNYIVTVLAIIAACCHAYAASPVQRADCGVVERLSIVSPQLGDSVDVDVWLPADYNPETKYPVVYMHDGQNLFDASTTWNGQSWEMDRAACRLIAEEQIPGMIIVGIHSDPARRVSQLMPVEAVRDAGLEDLMAEVKLKGMPVLGDQYVDFVVNTLKPMIDSRYSTLSDRENTMVMGSSMGGLMSLYLLCMKPEVFGGAGCLSTHWYGTLEAGDRFGNAMMNFVETHLPDPGTHRIYFDHGTSTIDAYYGPWETQALLIAQKKGYTYGENLDSYIDYGAPHEESAWSARVDRPLRFLLMKK